jgi:hypothetical protein
MPGGAESFNSRRRIRFLPLLGMVFLVFGLSPLAARGTRDSAGVQGPVSPPPRAGGLSPLDDEGDGEDGGGGEEEIPAEDDWFGFMPSLYSRGDQIFSLSLGVVVPTVFAKGDGEIIPRNMVIGGTGSLSYDYFFGSHFFVGGELQGMFASTLGNHMLFIIPISARAGYQFVVQRFEFPLSLGIGIAPQQFRTSKSYDYLGLFVKPRASVFFRFNPDWSFGLNTAWWWIPQITARDDESVHGHFFEATISARYHF